MPGTESQLKASLELLEEIRLNRIFAKIMGTSECEIAIGILFLNLNQPHCGYIFVIFYGGLFFGERRGNECHNSLYLQIKEA